MNLVRCIISAFLLVLLAISVAGWFWAADQPSPQSWGARLALVLCALISAGSLGLLWSAGRREPK